MRLLRPDQKTLFGLTLLRLLLSLIVFLPTLVHNFLCSSVLLDQLDLTRTDIWVSVALARSTTAVVFVHIRRAPPRFEAGRGYLRQIVRSTASFHVFDLHREHNLKASFVSLGKGSDRAMVGFDQALADHDSQVVVLLVDRLEAIIVHFLQLFMQFMTLLGLRKTFAVVNYMHL